MTKNWIGKMSLLAVVAAMALVGCGPKETATTEQETQTTAPTEQNATTQAPSKEEFEPFESTVDGIKLNVPKRFSLVETEVIAEEDNKGTNGSIYRFEDGNEVLEISRLYFPGVTVNEELIEEEVHLGQGLQVLRMDHMETKDGVKIYGVLTHDTALGNYVFYHRVQHGDYIISFLQQRPVVYSLTDEAVNKMMLMSLQLTE